MTIDLWTHVAYFYYFGLYMNTQWDWVISPIVLSYQNFIVFPRIVKSLVSLNLPHFLHKKSLHCQTIPRSSCVVLSCELWRIVFVYYMVIKGLLFRTSLCLKLVEKTISGGGELGNNHCIVKLHQTLPFAPFPWDWWASIFTKFPCAFVVIHCISDFQIPWCLQMHVVIFRGWSGDVMQI